MIECKKFFSKKKLIKIYSSINVSKSGSFDFVESYHFLHDPKRPDEKIKIALSTCKGSWRGNKLKKRDGVCAEAYMLDLDQKTIYGNVFDQVMKKSFCIYSLYVDDEYRGLGMADVMFLLAAQYARYFGKEYLLLVYPASGLGDFYQKYGLYPASIAFSQMRMELLALYQNSVPAEVLMQRYNEFYLLQGASDFVEMVAKNRVCEKWDAS
ncbi:hypothetical protein GCM10023116_00210 [Kistimonas scapharcae]|uniref:N-acetyltransferase domain-containing protein n=1 Tax=Kistimonas scapharcae TaxID=1036133 RepID=A0ABP8UXC4_9GAMM